MGNTGDFGAYDPIAGHINWGEPGSFGVYNRTLGKIEWGGDHVDGRYTHSLTVTDIASNWAENRATLGKSESVVLAAYREIESALPFDALVCTMGPNF